MRAHEILETEGLELDGDSRAMMMKLRKGMAASLNAGKFAALLPFLPGWSMKKVKLEKPSGGGWILKEDVPGASFHKSFLSRNDGRIHYTCYVPTKRDPSSFGAEYDARQYAETEQLYKVMTDRIVPQLTELAGKTQKRWNIRDLQINEVDGKYNVKELDVSFVFLVQMNGFQITSPEGETYEVYGDYKNGALEPHTFESFFKWANENTDIMDLILAALQMEAHEKKVDPRAKYTPPPTASAEEKKVFAFLREMTNDVRAQQKINRIEYMEMRVERIKEVIAEGDKKKIELFQNADPMLFQTVVSYQTKVLYPDWKVRVEQMVEKEVEEMQNMFVYKNTRKLAPILSAKGNMGQEKVISINTRQGIITSVIQFTFDDGSSFVVEQSIVASSTRDSWNRVTYFFRFPTTFHQVVLPSGEKMGMPSEERMNEIFAKA